MNDAQQTVNPLPLVSVITPTYNRASYLAETIDSVLGQTYPNIEYFVIDDGSTDNTQEIQGKYAGRLTWLTQPNQGETRTVNSGWSMAHGDYIMVVNSDDPILPHLVATMVAYMQEHPDLLMAYPFWYEIDEKSQIVREIILYPAFNYVDMVRYCACFPGPGALMRRRALELVPQRDTRLKYTADMEYWLRLGLHGPMSHVPQFLATHRVHPDSTGVSGNARVGIELVRMTKDFFTRPDLPPEIKALRRESISAAYYDAGLRCYQAGALQSRQLYWLSCKHLLMALLLRPRLRFEHPRQASLSYIGYLLVKQPIQSSRFRSIMIPARCMKRLMKWVHHEVFRRFVPLK